MKKLATLSVVCACLNPFLYCLAGDMGPIKEEGFGVYVPNLPSSYEVSGGAIFLRPGGSPDYNVLTYPFNPNVAVPADDPRWVVQNIRPDFSSGFSINLRHVFPNSGDDINLYWAHLRTNDTANTTAQGGLPPYRQMAGPFWEVGPDADSIREATGQVKFSYDVLNGEVAKHVHFGPDLKSRFFAGITGVWLKESLTATYSGKAVEIPTLIAQTGGSFTFSSNNTSKFDGAGLRLGLDGNYQLYKNFNIVGLFAGSILLGTEKPSTTFVGTSTFLTSQGIPINYQSIQHKNYTQVIPSVDAKLGLKYNYFYSPDCVLSIEGGYMGAVYVNAIQNYVPSTYVPGTQGIDQGAVFLQSLTKTTQDFSVNGPYVTASLRM